MKIWGWLAIGAAGLIGLGALSKMFKGKASSGSPTEAPEADEVYISDVQAPSITEVPVQGPSGGSTINLVSDSTIPIFNNFIQPDEPQFLGNPSIVQPDIMINQDLGTPLSANNNIPSTSTSTAKMMTDEDVKRNAFPQYRYIGKMVKNGKAYYCFIDDINKTSISNFEAFGVLDIYLAGVNPQSSSENVIVYEARPATPAKYLFNRLVNAAQPRLIEASAYRI